jgi:acetyltransferase
MERCRIHRALQGVRGQGPVDFAGLEKVLIRFGRLVAEQRRIKEIDVNPLLASPSRIVALDARVVLHDAKLAGDRLPKLAIRPYPTEYIFHHQLKDGTPVTLRPICPEDEPLIVEFHKTLSDQTVHYRYFSFLKLESRVAHSRLRRICFNDYDCEIALVAEHESPKTQAREILGIGRLIKSHSLDEAEFAIVISDAWQGQGLGTELLRRLLQIGRQERTARIVGYILRGNVPMRRVCEKLGFSLRYDAEMEAYKAAINLTPLDHE